MPVAPNRVLIILVAAVVSGGIGAAIGTAFPGRSQPPAAVAAPTPAFVVTPEPVPTVAPTPSPTPSAAPVERFVTTRRSVPTSASAPRRRSGGTGDVSQLPGPAQRAITNQPGQPQQPQSPDHP